LAWTCQNYGQNVGYFFVFCISNFYLIAIWDNVDNQKKFFENYATLIGFDAKDPSGWYLQSKEKFMALQVLLRYKLFQNQQVYY
jgi:hypothetical protein